MKPQAPTPASLIWWRRTIAGVVSGAIACLLAREKPAPEWKLVNCGAMGMRPRLTESGARDMTRVHIGRVSVVSTVEQACKNELWLACLATQNLAT